MLTHNPKQAAVLWGADNGTGLGHSFTFLPTNGASTPTSTQTLIVESFSQISTLQTSPQSFNGSASPTLTAPASPQASTVAGSSQNFSTSKAVESPPSPTHEPPLQHPSITGSPGAKAGIVVGAVLGVAALIAWVWLYAKLRKQIKSQERSVSVPGEPELVMEPLPEQPQEIDGRERAIELDSRAIHELDSAARHEIEARERAEELDSTARHELEARERAKELDSTAIYELEAREGARSLHGTPKHEQTGLANGAPAFPLWWAEVVRRLLS